MKTLPMLLGLIAFLPLTVSALNLVQLENQKAGTSDWQLSKLKKGTVPPLYAPEDDAYSDGWRRREEIEGYCSQTSVSAGDTLTIHISANPPGKYQVDIYRMGYYGGKGGRLMQSIGPLQGKKQPTPGDGVMRVWECQWEESIKLPIPADWLSGVYLGKLTSLENDGEAYVVFIVRDNRRADLMFQCSDMTWQSYNRWTNWGSLYDTADNPWGSSNNLAGFDVSFDRPYAIYWNGYPAGFEPLTNGSGEFLMIEHPLAYWLEKEGYDVTYISNIDTHTDAAGLLRVKAWLSVGHDEYWTQQMFDNVTAARDAGVSLAFLSGNSVSGIIELLPSGDGRPNRIMRRAGGFADERALMGSTTYGVGFADWTCDLPDHWIFEGTEMKKGDRVHDLVGWEYHGPPLADYETMEILSSGPVYGWNGNRRNSGYATTLYTAQKGNLVFNAATCWWNMVLSSPPGFMSPPRRYFKEDDVRVQRITANVLNRMIALDPR